MPRNGHGPLQRPRNRSNGARVEAGKLHGEGDQLVFAFLHLRQSETLEDRPVVGEEAGARDEGLGRVQIDSVRLEQRIQPPANPRQSVPNTTDTSS